EIGDGFVFVPAGACVLGGDAEAYDALPRQERRVEDFAIGRFPVTTRDYCGFLDALEREDPMAAARRSGQGRNGLIVANRKNAAGQWEPHPMMIEGDARSLFPIEDGHLWNVPATLIDWFDALAFCRWKSVRLPAEAEWEKAARGVD